MFRRRPGGAVFFGISNIVVGAMGLIFYVCSGLMVLGMTTSRNDSVWLYLQDQLPIFAPMATAHIVVSLILCLLLLLSGIGLFYMQNWGRLLGIACGILALLLNVWNVLFQLAWVNPVLQQRPFTFPFQPGFGPQAAAQRASHAVEVAMLNVSVLGAAALAILYGAALLITLLLPQVAAAFHHGPGPAWEDLDEDDRPRRRRDADDDWDD